MQLWHGWTNKISFCTQIYIVYWSLPQLFLLWEIISENNVSNKATSLLNIHQNCIFLGGRGVCTSVLLYTVVFVCMCVCTGSRWESLTCSWEHFHPWDMTKAFSICVCVLVCVSMMMPLFKACVGSTVLPLSHDKSALNILSCFLVTLTNAQRHEKRPKHACTQTHTHMRMKRHTLGVTTACWGVSALVSVGSHPTSRHHFFSLVAFFSLVFSLFSQISTFFHT